MIGMLLLVFFPFFYGIALSFTNANIYNTDKTDHRDLGRPRQLLGHPQRLPHRAPHGGTGWSGTIRTSTGRCCFTIVWTVANVAIGVTLGLALALILNTQGFRLARRSTACC